MVMKAILLSVIFLIVICLRVIAPDLFLSKKN